MSEPISSRTQQPCWITVQKGGQLGFRHPTTRAHTRPHSTFLPQYLQWDSNRCNLVCTRLHDLATKASSKSHSALTRLLGSRFTGASATCPDGLPRLTVPPHAFNVSGALPATLMPVAETASRGEHQPPHNANLVKADTSTSRGTRTRTPNRAPDFESGVSTIPPHWQKRERKQTQETTTRPQCAQPAGHTHTSRTTSQPNPRARTPSTGQPRPAQLTHQHREHPGANTQAPPAHTQRTLPCRHTPLRDSTRSREHPRVASAPRSA